jgi:hypothetical protein
MYPQNNNNIIKIEIKINKISYSNYKRQKAKQSNKTKISSRTDTRK